MRFYNLKKQKSLSRYEQVLAMREDASTQQKSLKKAISMKSTPIALILFAIILFWMGFITSTFLSKAHGIRTEDETPRFKYITNIEVASGDTLWDIAGEYMSPEYENRYEYIREVCKINHLNSWNIEAGEYLVVPYFSSEYK